MKLTIPQVEAHGGYSVVYADPPWAYDQKVRVTLDEAKYPTMSLEEIEALPVQRLAGKNSALFLWCTWPHVALGSHVCVMRAWGFEPKTPAFVWVKRNKNAGSLVWGNGSWTRANTEPCFLGVRGRPVRIDKGVHQVLEDFVPEEVLDAVRPGEKHSAKPQAARERIIRLLGDVPRIELFARERVQGFDCWGNEAPDGGDLDMEPNNSTWCSICGEVQLLCRSGHYCNNGHGGAPSIESAEAAYQMRAAFAAIVGNT